MDTAKFNQMLRSARNGGRTVIGGAASELQALFRKMTVGFLRKKGVRFEATLVDDLVSALFIRLLGHKTIPKGYTWNSWFYYAIKSVWSEYCRDILCLPERSLDSDPEVSRHSAHGLPIPIEANARLLEGNLVEHLRSKALKAGPVVTPDQEVWRWAVNMLLDYGTIQNEKNAAVRSGLSVDACRLIIFRAILKARLLFEDLYGRQEQYTLEECAEARDLAGRIF